ncbi:glutathione S-transferase family protein [Chromobacterium vaccinii]|uniref:Glutathione S-transferase n=1 Tax=Chromobacterium vaccinii TaxID=1108595 RepID=A0A1D9LEA4_9NEIS|nr:glutathione S-transferase [Chromobacterium vaccinii]AOZ49596.1 glutathione S-transferase [Chromobacterium vaccinii]
MKLIGMLDSPYVRRVAVSLQLLDLPFEHHPLSVFSAFDRFREINPVVKAPTLICDDGTALMDSTLILQYAESIAPGRSLLPADPQRLLRSLRVTGLALAACEKSVQIVYERKLRPEDARYQPWLERISSQLLAAYDELERELASGVPDIGGGAIDQAWLSTAVAWHFSRRMTADIVQADEYPALAALSARAEALDAFRAAPYGDGAYPVRF